MRRGHQRGKELAYELADASSFSTEAGFATHIRKRYGEDLAAGLHSILAAKGDEALLMEAEEVERLSPQAQGYQCCSPSRAWARSRCGSRL